MRARRLHYFELRGRAEPARLMLHALGIPFEDRRVVDAETWEVLKPRLPFGSLPVYEDGATCLAQSHAIFRHLAREQSWLGDDPVRDALLDATQEALAEAQEDLWRFAWIPDHHEKREAYARDTLAPTLARLAAWLRRDARDGPYFVGDSPSHVDFVAFCYLDELDAFFAETLAAHPALVRCHAAVAKLPGVAAYLSSDARSPVFGMGNRGPKVDPRVQLAADALLETPWTRPIPLAPLVRT